MGKTAVVMEMKDGYAILMKAGGGFFKVPAKKGWAIGDIVFIRERTRQLKTMYAAACLLLLFFGGGKLYFTETALVSIDINPSIELKVNSFDRIISTNYFNSDGRDILSGLSLNGKKTGDALDVLFTSQDFQPYLEGNEYMVITVSGDESLKSRVDIQAAALGQDHGLQISCHGADKEIVAQAHSYGMSPGRYMAFLDLQELVPDVNIEDYAHCGYGQIQKEINAHHENRQGQGRRHGHQNGSRH